MPSTATASGLATRYATALFDLAKQKNEVDQVNDDLQGLSDALDESPELKRLIESPVLARDEQENGILSVAEQAGVRELTGNFLGTLARNRRLYVLPGAIRAFQDLVAQSRGEVTAEVTSAQELTAEQERSVREAAKRFAGRDVNLRTNVDPSLLGGLVVKVGSRMLDVSLKSKLQQLEQSMRGTR